MKHTKYEDYVCAYCFNQLPQCTCDCGNFTLIQIDENIQYAVRVLNEKGWITQFCCEGHYTEGGKGDVLYIAFDKWIELPSVPVGWELKKHGDTIMIECDCKSKSKVAEKRKAQFEEKKRIALENLNSWVESLDVNFD